MAELVHNEKIPSVFQIMQYELPRWTAHELYLVNCFCNSCIFTFTMEGLFQINIYRMMQLEKHK